MSVLHFALASARNTHLRFKVLYVYFAFIVFSLVSFLFLFHKTQRNALNENRKKHINDKLNKLGCKLHVFGSRFRGIIVSTDTIDQLQNIMPASTAYGGENPQ